MQTTIECFLVYHFGSVLTAFPNPELNKGILKSKSETGLRKQLLTPISFKYMAKYNLQFPIPILFNFDIKI